MNSVQSRSHTTKPNDDELTISSHSDLTDELNIQHKLEKANLMKEAHIHYAEIHEKNATRYETITKDFNERFTPHPTQELNRPYTPVDYGSGLPNNVDSEDDLDQPNKRVRMNHTCINLHDLEGSTIQFIDNLIHPLFEKGVEKLFQDETDKITYTPANSPMSVYVNPACNNYGCEVTIESPDGESTATLISEDPSEALQNIPRVTIDPEFLLLSGNEHLSEELQELDPSEMSEILDQRAIKWEADGILATYLIIGTNKCRRLLSTVKAAITH